MALTIKKFINIIYNGKAEVAKFHSLIVNTVMIPEIEAVR